MCLQNVQLLWIGQLRKLGLVLGWDGYSTQSVDWALTMDQTKNKINRECCQTHHQVLVAVKLRTKWHSPGFPCQQAWKFLKPSAPDFKTDSIANSCWGCRRKTWKIWSFSTWNQQAFRVSYLLNRHQHQASPPAHAKIELVQGNSSWTRSRSQETSGRLE